MLLPLVGREACSRAFFPLLTSLIGTCGCERLCTHGQIQPDGSCRVADKKGVPFFFFFFFFLLHPLVIELFHWPTPIEGKEGISGCERIMIVVPPLQFMLNLTFSTPMQPRGFEPPIKLVVC